MTDKIQKMNGTKYYSPCFQYVSGHKLKNYYTHLNMMDTISEIITKGLIQ